MKKHKFFRAKEEVKPKFRRGRNEDEYPKRHKKRGMDEVEESY